LKARSDVEVVGVLIAAGDGKKAGAISESMGHGPK
jgi:hypothetical protein